MSPQNRAFRENHFFFFLLKISRRIGCPHLFITVSSYNSSYGTPRKPISRGNFSVQNNVYFADWIPLLI